MFEALNKNISLLLSKKNLTSKELAELVQIPLPTINRLRSDSHLNPTLSSLLPLCHYFKISVDQLIGLEPLVFEDQGAELQPTLKKIPFLAWNKIPFFNITNDYSKNKNFVYSELQEKGPIMATIIEDLDHGFFKKGTTLFIALDKIPNNGDYVVVYSVDKKTIGIKQVLKDIAATYLVSVIPGIENLELSDHYPIFGVILQAKIDFCS